MQWSVFSNLSFSKTVPHYTLLEVNLFVSQTGNSSFTKHCATVPKAGALFWPHCKKAYSQIWFSSWIHDWQLSVLPLAWCYFLVTAGLLWSALAPLTEEKGNHVMYCEGLWDGPWQDLYCAGAGRWCHQVVMKALGLRKSVARPISDCCSYLLPKCFSWVDSSSPEMQGSGWVCSTLQH